MSYVDWSQSVIKLFTKSDQVQKFPCSLARNTTSHSMENLAFHSLLRWGWLYYYSHCFNYALHLRRLHGRMYFFSTWEWKGNLPGSQVEKHSFVGNVVHISVPRLHRWCQPDFLGIVRTQNALLNHSDLSKPVHTFCENPTNLNKYVPHQAPAKTPPLWARHHHTVQATNVN